MARYLSTVFFLLVGLLSVSFLSAAAAWAQQADGTIEMTEGAVSIKRVALVIGNSSYETAPLANPVNDAELMTKTLESTGFEVISLRDADKEEIYLAIVDFGEKLRKYGPNTVGLFYFAGHGIQSGGANYLIPMGMDIKKERQLRVLAVESQFLLDEMRRAGNEINIIILDACRNNPYPRSSRSAASGLATQEGPAPDSILLAFSTAPNQVAADGDGDNSPYVQALVKQMLIPGQGLLDVFAKASAAVAKRTNREQIPWRQTSILTNDSFYFTGKVTIEGRLASLGGTVPADRIGAPVLDKESLFWQTVRDSDNPADVREYLEQHPDGYFAGLAKNRLAAIQKALQDKERALGLSLADRHKLQEMLTVLGYGTGDDAEGVFGPGTRAAIGRYQQAKHQPETGHLTAEPMRALLEEGKSIQARRKKLTTSEKRKPVDFWATATLEQAELLISDVSAKDWPVFITGPKDWQKELSRLHLAAEAGNEQIVQFLLEKGTDINARDGSQNTPLHRAASYGHEQVAQLLLSTGADIEARDEDQRTPLHHAAENGHEQVAELLLEKGADIEARDWRQDTPLHEAAESGHERVAELLLEKGADINARYGGQTTPLQEAIMRGHKKIVQLMLEKGVDIEARDGGLHLAAEGGHEKIVALLLEKGADTEARGERQNTPLHYAVEGGHEKIVQLLLDNGADINARDEDQVTPLHYADRGGHEKIVQLLLSKGANVEARDWLQYTLLHKAAEAGHEKMVQLLLEKGALPDARDDVQNTPLHDAAKQGHEKIVQLLLEKGADINARDEFQYTPLHYATGSENEKIVAFGSEHEKIVALLLEKGADINARDGSQNTPLHGAAGSENEKIVALLLEKGVDINARNEYQVTPLHYAAGSENEKIVALLLEKGALLDARDDVQNTPLHYAAKQGHEKIVQLLLEKGADIEARDGGQNTPLHLAAWYEKIVQLLLEKGADIKARNEDENTPLHTAAEHGYEKIVQLLLSKGASLDTRNGKGETALDVAEREDETKSVDLLQAKLHQQAERKQTEGRRLQKLEEKDAEGFWRTATPEQVRLLVFGIEAKDWPELAVGGESRATGMSRLHVAVRLGRGEMVELLLEKGADIDAHDGDRDTSLHLAVETGNKGLVQLLLAKGADINVHNNKGETALSVAKRVGKTELADFLQANQKLAASEGKRRRRILANSDSRAGPAIDLRRAGERLAGIFYR